MLTASTNCCFDFSISPEAVCATQGKARSANRTARAAAFMFVSATGPTCLSEDVVSAIDIDRFSSDQLGVIRRQDGGRDADILNADEVSQRSAFGGALKQLDEMVDAGRGARLHRPRRDGVD